jgi:hypothetical protein
MCAAKRYVRFTPNSDHEIRHPQTAMSPLRPKADMCDALAHVCFGPKADIYPVLGITHVRVLSNARVSIRLK